MMNASTRITMLMSILISVCAGILISIFTDITRGIRNCLTNIDTHLIEIERNRQKRLEKKIAKVAKEPELKTTNTERTGGKQ